MNYYVSSSILAMYILVAFLVCIIGIISNRCTKSRQSSQIYGTNKNQVEKAVLHGDEEYGTKGKDLLEFELGHEIVESKWKK